MEYIFQEGMETKTAENTETETKKVSAKYPESDRMALLEKINQKLDMLLAKNAE